jgi:predicted PurR-regulated permease PerM
VTPANEVALDPDSREQEVSTMADTERDVTRSLAVLFIVGLIGSSIWILRPFLGAIVWAATIVVSTWPLMIAVQSRLWGKRTLAVTVMTFVLLGVLVVPLAFAIGAIVSNVDQITEWTQSLATLGTPSPPEWVARLPLVGAKAAELWRHTATAGLQEITVRAAPYAGIVITWFVVKVGNVGVLLVEFLLTVVLAAAMYANGERLAARLMSFGRRLAGQGGENAVHLAGQTIRGVALGVVVTALAQALFGGLGLAIAGVPFVGCSPERCSCSRSRRSAWFRSSGSLWRGSTGPENQDGEHSCSSGRS